MSAGRFSPAGFRLPGRALCALAAATVTAMVLPACLRPMERAGRPPSGIPTEDLHGAPMYRVLERDAIPAIDDPRFVRASEASFMQDDEPVLGVFDGKTAKAYSLWLLDHHEIVNDRLGDTPIAATW